MIYSQIFRALFALSLVHGASGTGKFKPLEPLTRENYGDTEQRWVKKKNNGSFPKGSFPKKIMFWVRMGCWCQIQYATASRRDSKRGICYKVKIEEGFHRNRKNRYPGHGREMVNRLCFVSYAQEAWPNDLKFRWELELKDSHLKKIKRCHELLCDGISIKRVLKGGHNKKDVLSNEMTLKYEGQDLILRRTVWRSQDLTKCKNTHEEKISIKVGGRVTLRKYEDQKIVTIPLAEPLDDGSDTLEFIDLNDITGERWEMWFSKWCKVNYRQNQGRRRLLRAEHLASGAVEL